MINGKLLECKGTVTAVLLSLEGKKEISLGGDYYDMDDVQQLEVLTEGAECAELTPSKFQSLSSLITKLPLVANRELLAIPNGWRRVYILTLKYLWFINDSQVNYI